MDQILDQLVQQADANVANGASSNGNGNSSGHAAAEDPAGVVSNLTSSDLNPNMDDVIKVLNDFGEDFTGGMGASAGSGSAGKVAPSTAPGPPVVDQATVANEKLKVLESRQDEIEHRFQSICRRIHLMRSRTLGSHAASEVKKVTQYAQAVAPTPAHQPPMAPTISPFQLNVRPANVPDGIVLPDAPVQPSDVKVKEETVNQDGQTGDSIPRKVLTLDSRERADESLGQIEANLRHLVHNYDTDATESSSGGESADEMDNFNVNNVHYLPVKRRAKYTWLEQRAGIASRWTWLTAQISDLEYRIRQQTEFFRHIRSTKGPVTLGEPVISWPAHAKKPVMPKESEEVPLSVKPVTRDYSRVDSSGRKIIIKEPMARPEPQVPEESGSDNSLGACRTRPLKGVKRRRFLKTEGLYRVSSRAGKESSVRCDCIHPNVWCAICYGKTNHTQVPDHVTQDRRHCLALLDHSYHAVLSSPDDVPLNLHLMHRIKNRSWVAHSSGAGLTQLMKEGESVKKKVKKMKKDEELKMVKKIKKKPKDMKDIKTVKKLKSRASMGDKFRRKSLTIHHHGDDSMINDISGEDLIHGVDTNSPVPSPSIGAGHQAWAETIRKRRETAFDINNIVIPYSMAAATRVEKLKYKEIMTPQWRSVATNGDQSKDKVNSSRKEDEKENVASTGEKIGAAKEESSSRRKLSTSSEPAEPVTASSDKDSKPVSGKTRGISLSEEPVCKVAKRVEKEDISTAVYEIRHARAEVEEQRRWQTPQWKSSGGQRQRSRRQDSRTAEGGIGSSGYNTPDPLSPGMVERVDTFRGEHTPFNAHRSGDDHPVHLQHQYALLQHGGQHQEQEENELGDQVQRSQSLGRYPKLPLHHTHQHATAVPSLSCPRWTPSSPVNFPSRRPTTRKWRTICPTGTRGRRPRSPERAREPTTPRARDPPTPRPSRRLPCPSTPGLPA